MSSREGMYLYSLRNDGIYYKDKKIKGVDRYSFTIVEGSPRGSSDGKDDNVYAKDKGNVYYCGEMVIGANPNSFRPIKHFYFRDNKYVYYKGKKIEGVDPNGFEPHVSYKDLSFDKFNNVYVGGEKKKINSKIFLDVFGYYTLHVGSNNELKILYESSHEVEGADPRTFFVSMLDPYNDASDKRFKYKNGKKVSNK